MICPWCKKEFERTAPRQFFCSKDCQWKHHLEKKNASRRAARAAAAIEKVCVVCGKKFLTTYSHKRYCSARCRQYRSHTAERARISARKLAARAGRVCPVCGAVFTPGNSRGVYCSKRCLENSKRTTASHAITFVQPKDPRCDRASFAKVRAYLALPARQRWRKLDTLTPAEQKLARRLWDEQHSGFARVND